MKLRAITIPGVNNPSHYDDAPAAYAREGLWDTLTRAWHRPNRPGCRPTGGGTE